MPTLKPDELSRVWAETALAGNVQDPDLTTPGKFAAGWVAEVPPFEWFNFLQRQVTQGLAHANEQGILAWDTDTVYPTDGLAKGSNGIIYRAIQEQSGNDPVSDGGTNWVELVTKKYAVLSQMVADDTLTVGQYVHVEGRTNIFDKGGNIYEIVAAGTGTDDGGSYIDLATHQAAGIFPNGYITLEQFGAPGGTVSDSQPAIQAAIDAAPTLGLNTIVATQSVYRLDAGLITPVASKIILKAETVDGSIFRYFANVIGLVVQGPVSGVINRLRFELDSSVTTRTTNCIEVGTMSDKANAFIFNGNIVGWGHIENQTGDGVYIRNGNFCVIGDCNIEEIGRDSLHVSDDTGDTNAGIIRNCYTNVSGRDAYYFGNDVSGWVGTPRCLRFQRYGINFDGARFNRLDGDIESVGPQGQAWTFGPDVFEGYVDGVNVASGAYGNEAVVFPVSSSTFADTLAEDSNEVLRRAGANEYRSTYGSRRYAGNLILDDEMEAGEFRMFQSDAAEYTFQFGGTGGASKLIFANGGSTADIEFDAKLEVIPDGRVINPNPNADQFHVHNTAGNAGIGIYGDATSFVSLRMGDAGEDSAGMVTYDNSTDALAFYSNASLAASFDSNQHFFPGTDNTQTCGAASFRWSEFFAGNGTINTSDMRLKTEFQGFTDCEKAAAQEIRGIIGKYQWLDSVEKKGEDGARIQIGVGAQEVGRIMEKHGLDPNRYSFYCYDEWPEHKRLVKEESKVLVKEEVVTRIPAEYEDLGPEYDVKPAVYKNRKLIKKAERVMVRESRLKMISKEIVEITPAEYEIIPAEYETIPAGNRYGIRPDQLNMFILANI